MECDLGQTLERLWVGVWAASWGNGRNPKCVPGVHTRVPVGARGVAESSEGGLSQQAAVSQGARPLVIEKRQRAVSPGAG